MNDGNEDDNTLQVKFWPWEKNVSKTIISRITKLIYCTIVLSDVLNLSMRSILS